MLKTPYFDWHESHGGRIVDFAGWAMPVQYTSITEEHAAVRTRCGVFDISHMGRLEFQGPDAVKLLDHLLTNDASALQPGQVRYSLVCNEQGGILDDVLVYRVSEGLDGEPTHLLVVNASNRVKILNWIERHRGGFDAEISDRTFEWTMLALQGPGACELFAGYGSPDPTGNRYYTAWRAKTPRGDVIASRTGYTGEDGIELMIPKSIAADVWNDLWEGGRKFELAACGLGCRDTLRLEAAMPLYGHELTESIDPLTAGLSFAVKLQKPSFIGRDALQAVARQPAKSTRVGLKLSGRRIAREHSAVKVADRAVGEVTSGTFSPTLQEAIAMAYVEPALAKTGQQVEIDIRGKTEPAVIVPLPFYKRPKS
jgi:aminomethyltransferase